jgi:ABC-type sugar transport system substrate-binding protein
MAEELVGLFLRSADNAYQRQLKVVALREAKRQGYALAVQSVPFDSAQQVEQIRAAIRTAAVTKLIAILVSGVRDLDLAPVAREAADAGLDWALLNDAAYLDDLRKAHPDRAIFAATCDHTEIGRVQARQIRALLGEQGRILCVTGPSSNIDARLRLEGLKQGLDSGFQITEVEGDWTSEGARRAVQGWADRCDVGESLPHAFVAQNDEMALGLRQAVRELESERDWPLAGMPIVGCDGAEDFGQRLVREGRLKATVIMPPGSGAAIEWIARVRSGRERPPVRLLLPVVSFPALSRLKH